MSSPTIVAETRQFLTTAVRSQLPKKLHGLFDFGIKALTLQPLVSCNSNARIARRGSRAAAEQQMYRLLRHRRLCLHIWRPVARRKFQHHDRW